MREALGPDAECTCHIEPNALAYCPSCGEPRLILRDTVLLTVDQPYAYDPICGYTAAIPPSEKGANADMVTT